MERHDSMTRAVRYLLGAGMFAAAVTTTTELATAQTLECLQDEGIPAVCGHVFTEGPDGAPGSDNTYQMGEGTPNIDVYVTDDQGHVVAVNTPQVNPTQSNMCVPDSNNIDCGYYKFFLPPPPNGETTYWVCIVMPGETNTNCADATAHPEGKPIAPTGSGQIVDLETPSEDAPEPEKWGVGTGTPGYWKNHPEAWPGDVTIGGVTYLNQKTAPAGKFTKYDAIKWMGKVGGDKTITMFSSLISAKLNSMLANNTVCVAPTIGKADIWMTQHPVGSNVKASSAAWIEGEPWHQLMDDYNNGKLCAPHRD